MHIQRVIVSGRIKTERSFVKPFYFSFDSVFLILSDKDKAGVSNPRAEFFFSQRKLWHFKEKQAPFFIPGSSNISGVIAFFCCFLCSICTVFVPKHTV